MSTRRRRAARFPTAGGDHRPPPTYLREYIAVVCAPGQVAVSGNVLLPGTYRHNQYPRLSNRWSRELAPQFAQGPRAEDVTATLDGTYFWLGSEWRGHFGHVMTDQLPRMWVWSRAKAEYPELKALLSLASAHSELPRWQVELFGAAGIDEEDLVAITEPMRVERLLAATSMFSMPSYVHPGVTDVWDGIGRTLSANATPGPYASRIFVSRRPSNDYARGGPTSAENGIGLCQRGNLVDQVPGWHITGNARERVIVTPTGHRYESRPPPALGPTLTTQRAAEPQKARAG